MLRLFRNYLCLATILQLGTCVQAQQSTPAAKTAGKPVGTSQSAGAAKPAAAAPVKAAKVEAAASKVDPKGVPQMKSANAPAPASSKPDPKAVKPVDAKAPKTVDAKADPKAAKPVDAKSGPKAGKAADVKGDAKSNKTTEPKTAKHTATPRPALVPPPPPDTPTMFADGVFPGFAGMTDYTNPAIVAGRRKDLVSQMASAKKVLADKEQRTKELKEKAVQFEQLFSEGVISRRELETAQKEAASAATELNDAKTQSIALENAVSRLDSQHKPKSVAANNKKRIKATATTKTTVKVTSAAVKQSPQGGAANAATASGAANASKSNDVNGSTSTSKSSDVNGSTSTNKSSASTGSTSTTKSSATTSSNSPPKPNSNVDAKTTLMDSVPGVDAKPAEKAAGQQAPVVQTKTAAQPNAKPASANTP